VSKIGIFPGTFDPVHDGHIAFALAALQTCGLDKVVLLPERQPRQKNGVTALNERVAMLKLAAANYPQLQVVELPDDVFTVRGTLPELQRRFGDRLTLLLGSDVARTFAHRWPDLDKLLDVMSLAIGLRRQDSQADIAALLAELGRPVQTCFVPIEKPHAASSAVRQGAQAEHVDSKVQGYIKEHKLYLAAE
jgi:nicotinate-nucleotide adenylyltransferase